MEQGRAKFPSCATCDTLKAIHQGQLNTWANLTCSLINLVGEFINMCVRLLKLKDSYEVVKITHTVTDNR